MIGQETREVERKIARFCNSVTLGKANEAVCETPVRFNRIWMVLHSGLNAVAAAAETGMNVTTKAMNGDWRRRIKELLELVSYYMLSELIL